MAKRTLIPFLALLASLSASPAFPQSAPFPPTLPSHTVYGNMGPVAGPARAVSIATLQAAINPVTVCPNVVGDNSTDNSTAITACISAANATGNASIVLPAGIILAPTLSTSITATNVWLVCEGGPGACILKGTVNGMLTWTGAFGGTFNMGFDNAGANTVTTIAVNSFGTEFINPYLGAGIANFIALNSANSNAITIDGAFGTPRCDGGLPLIVANNGNGLVVRNSQMSGNCSAGTVSGGRTFVSAESATIDTIILQNNLVQIFDYPIKVTAGNGVTIQDIFMSGNVWDNMQHGYSFTANGSGFVASLSLQDKWIGTTTSSAANCLSLLGTGTIQGVVASPKFGGCGASGIVASVTTLKSVTFDQIAMDGLNLANTTGTAAINLAGGATYSYISIIGSKGGYTGVSSTHQPQNGITIGAAIDHLTVIGNDFQGSTANYNGMLAGTTATFSHTNTVQRANVGLIDAPGYVNGGAFVTPTANGQVSLGASATNGAIIGGQGSSADVSIANKSGTILCQVGTGTTTLTCTTLTATGTISSGGSASILNGTAIPAGGTTGAGYNLSSTANFGTFFGSGVPTLSAAQGSLYLRSDGGSLTRLYVNTNGTTGYSSIPVSTDIATIRYVLTGINFNQTNTDNAITITLPPGITRWRINGVFVSNASASITTATAGLFTGAGGTGTAICATQAMTVSTSATDTLNNLQLVTTFTNANQTSLNDTTIFWRLVNPQGSAATADVIIDITPLS